MDWFPLALACAFLLAASDAATKRWLADLSPTELTLVRYGVPALLMLPALARIDLAALPLAFWGWVGAAVPLEIAAMLLYMRALQAGPLALTVPYLAFTPAFAVFSGWLLLGERVSWGGGLGIALVLAGALLLNPRLPGEARVSLARLARHPGSRLMLAVALLYSVTSALGKGALAYLPPAAFPAVYFAVLTVASFAVLAPGRPGLLRGALRRPWAALLVGALTAGMILTHFQALARVEVAYMIAVKRTSLLFGIVWGHLLFREAGLARHLGAGTVMVAGVALLLLAG